MLAHFEKHKLDHHTVFFLYASKLSVRSNFQNNVLAYSWSEEQCYKYYTTYLYPHNDLDLFANRPRFSCYFMDKWKQTKRKKSSAIFDSRPVILILVFKCSRPILNGVCCFVKFYNLGQYLGLKSWNRISCNNMLFGLRSI